MKVITVKKAIHKSLSKYLDIAILRNPEFRFAM